MAENRIALEIWRGSGALEDPHERRSAMGITIVYDGL
jgi:hypothetical protein